jgi:hypothetical protein
LLDPAAAAPQLLGCITPPAGFGDRLGIVVGFEVLDPLDVPFRA